MIVWNATHGWASFLFQGGRAALSTMASPRPVDPGLAGPGDVSVSVDLGAARSSSCFGGCRNWRRIGEIERLWLALAVAPLGVFHTGRLFSACFASLGVDRTGIALPAAGAKMVRTPRRRVPARPGGCSSHCGGFSVAFLAFTIVEYRYGILQRDRDGRGGSDRCFTRSDARPLRLGSGRPEDALASGWSRILARSSSPASGIKAPSSPTP